MYLPQTHTVRAGTTVRLRIVNTDQVALLAELHGIPFRIVAADGRDIPGAAEVSGRAVHVPAGGRIDLSFAMPEHPVTLSRDASDSVSYTFAPQGWSGSAGAIVHGPEIDLLQYGSALPPQEPLPPRGHGAGTTREVTMVLDRLPRFLSGVPMNGYVVNGAVAPHIPPIRVAEGDIVRITAVNRGWEPHPCTSTDTTCT